MGLSGMLLPVLVLSVVAGTAIALQCFKCGQYNDGVGSITPCINYTHMSLQDCPSLDHVYCIKYISEGSTVRDCVARCEDKESWSARTYCCKEDGCNSSPTARAGFFLTTVATIITALVAAH